MTLSEFNALDLTNKSDLIWEWGHYLTSRKNETHNVILFLLHDFFAEVHIVLSDNATTHIVGLAKNAVHPDFIKALNHDDPFVKVFLREIISQTKAA